MQFQKNDMSRVISYFNNLFSPQLFLNGISYSEMIPPHHTTVSVVGMAGGRLYEVILEAYPTDAMFLPHKSNKLVT